MSVLSLKRMGLFAALSAALIGCSSKSDKELSDTDIVRGIFTSRSKVEPPSAQQVAAQVQAALAATDAGLVLVALPNRKAVAVMQQIETNGPFVTYGTRERISLTLRDGIVTATRGLGDDLMSSQVAAASQLIRHRRAGQADRVQRFLDGENKEIAQTASCAITIGGAGSVQLGEAQRATQAVTETCQAPSGAYQNSYQVDRATGRILQSKQWIGALNQHMVLQVLR